MDRLQCPKCEDEMEEGFRLDRTEPHLGYNSEQWMPGERQASFWTGVKIDSSQLREVITYRCRGCGYLESYAP